MTTVGDRPAAEPADPSPHRVVAVYRSTTDMPGVYRCSDCRQWVAKADGRRTWVHTNQDLNPASRFRLRSRFLRRSYLYR